MSTGVNLGYQFTPFQKVSAGYSLRYDAYFRAPDTAEDFVVPARTVDARRGRRATSTAGTATASAAARRSSRGRRGPHGGRRTTSQADGQTYRRHSIGAAKDFLFGPFQSVHVGAGWYGGARLDRFSMYQFGLFDELRMHGVPAAGIRFSELALLRGSYSFNMFGLYRLDLFVDHARGRDPRSARHLASR